VKTVKKILAVPEEREEVKEWEISPQEEQRSMEANEEESQKIEEEKKRGERGENVVEVRMGTRAPSIYEHDPVDINSGDHVLFRARDPPLLVVLPKGEGCDKFEEELDKFVTRQDKEVHGKGKKRASTERLRVLFEERETECKELAKKFGGGESRRRRRGVHASQAPILTILHYALVLRRGATNNKGSQERIREYLLRPKYE
jgi:hypothetical protein